MNDATIDVWIELAIAVPPGLEELAAESLLAAPFTGVLVEQGRVRTYVRADLWDDAVRARIDCWLAETGCRAAVRRLPAVDYEARARASWRPFRVDRLVVALPDGTPAIRPGDVVLRLAPGGAYGTGRHASTRGALLLLQRCLARGERVLDAGTGSGILAVAAVRLGASAAAGFDIDPIAVGFARALAADNGVSARCAFHEVGFEAMPAELDGFDGVVANLYGDLLQRHAGDLAARLRDGGWFVAAGCRRSEEESTRTALADAGLVTTRVWRRGKWCAFVGRQRSRAAERAT